MVCFEIRIAYPQSKRNVINQMNERRLEHIRKLYNADAYDQGIEDNVCSVRLTACDMDAAGILRDIPPEMYCVWVKILRTDIFLYSFYKVTQKKVIPPRDPLLKQVYWAASQLEPRYLRASTA